MSSRALALLRRIAARGRLALLGDPGRAYLPKSGLTELARYTVPTSRELEAKEVSEGWGWQVLPEGEEPSWPPSKTIGVSALGTADAFAWASSCSRPAGSRS